MPSDILGITLKLIAGGMQLKKKVVLFSLEINLLQTEGKNGRQEAETVERLSRKKEAAVLWEAKAFICRKTSAAPTTK